MRYVMRPAKMRTIPEEALPRLPSGAVVRALGFAPAHPESDDGSSHGDRRGRPNHGL